MREVFASRVEEARATYAEQPAPIGGRQEVAG